MTEACNNVPSFHLVNIAQLPKNSKVPLCLMEILYHILILDWSSRCVLIEIREMPQIKFKFRSDLIPFYFRKIYHQVQKMFDLSPLLVILMNSHLLIHFSRSCSGLLMIHDSSD